MGRPQRSKNSRKNMRNINKRSEGYQTRAERKKEKKRLKQETKMEKKFLIAIYNNYRAGGLSTKNLVLKDSKLIGTYTTEPEYTMYSLEKNSDSIVVQGGNYSIKLEVWEVTEEILTKIEQAHYYYEEIEDIHQHYLKKKILTPFGESIIFIYNDSCSEFKTIVNGDWIEYENYKRILN